MSKPTTGLRRAGIASFATGALALSACVVGAGAASADADFAFDRIAGDNRYETAGEVYDAFGTSDSVILANGEQGHYPDALVANYLAGVDGSPILLTRADKMPEATQSRLDAADKNITIVGGEGVVSAEQEAALEADGHTVTRLAGDNRYETAAAVIDAAGDAASTTALISTGVDFPDALAAGPVSYDQGSPLAISKADDINDAEVNELVESGVSDFIVVGGPNVVGSEVVQELEAAGLDFLTRLAGEDRAETSVAVANYAIENYGFTNTAINVASGYVAGTGADALAGGPLSGQNSTANLITRNVNNPGDSVLAFLEDNAATLTEGIIFGGPGAVSEAAETAMETAARSVSSNQDFAVTGQEAATNTVSEGSTTNANRGLRSYSVSGLGDGTYDIRLFPAENVTVDDNGVVSFADADVAGAGNGEADIDEAAVDAVIEVVNGATQASPDEHVDGVSPVSGTITFSIDSTSTDSVVPVVFSDTEGDDTLELDSNNQPTEPFGVGGQKTWVPEEAAAGEPTGDETVRSVNKDDDSFITDNALYEYDSNDVFYVDANDNGTFEETERGTLEDFEAALSAGDVLDADSDYESNDAFSSTFKLNDDAPTGPTSVDSALQDDGRTIEVTFNESTTDSVDSYNVYRGQLSEQQEEANEDLDPTNDVDCSALADSDYAAIASVSDDNDGNGDGYSYTDEGTDFDESYCYAVSAVDGGEESGLVRDADTIATADSALEQVRPTLTDADLTTDAAPNTVIGENDTITLQFSENMDADSDTGKFRFTDPDDEVFEVDCTAVGTTCTLVPGDADGDGTVEAGEATSAMTVAFAAGAAPTKVGGPAGDGLAQVPSTITAVSGEFQDVAGNDLDLANSTDKVIDNEF